MSKCTLVNIFDMIQSIGEEATKSLFSDFSCSKNPEIENFLKCSALEFAKKKMSVTYLVIDENSALVAYFTLAHKAVQIPNDNLSNSLRKKLNRFACLDEQSNLYTISAFLIAQLGKNSNYSDIITGNELLELAISVLVSIQKAVGGGVIYLECENRGKLLEFYGNNNFRIFGERYAEGNQMQYLQLLRIL